MEEDYSPHNQAGAKPNHEAGPDQRVWVHLGKCWNQLYPEETLWSSFQEARWEETSKPSPESPEVQVPNQASPPPLKNLEGVK